MKTLSALILSLLISSNAFATHAYRSEHCKSETHNLDYRGNYPFGGLYGISLPDQTQEEETTALPLEEGEYENTLEDAEVIFKQVDYKITEDSGEVNECYFDHREWKSEQVVEIGLISVEASKNLSLKPGDRITFICEETTDFPNGNNCEDEEIK